MLKFLNTNFHILKNSSAYSKSYKNIKSPSYLKRESTIFFSPVMEHTGQIQSFFLNIKYQQNLKQYSKLKESSMFKKSQYRIIEDEINLLMAEKQIDYVTLVKKLEGFISSYFKALNIATNPVVHNLSDWDEEDLKFLIKEYSGFSNETIHMFLDANIRLEWSDVKKEIDRNVSEEMGVLTDNIPHLELMRRGYKDELGIETENVDYTPVTLDFIKRMRALFKKSNSAFICGALLAFEATATFEFKIVEKVLRLLKTHQNDIIEPNSITGRYIAAHVNEEGPGMNPEDDHYNGMQQSIAKYINENNAREFSCGFLSVCKELNMWWEKISLEVYANRLSRTLDEKFEENKTLHLVKR